VEDLMATRVQSIQDPSQRATPKVIRPDG